MSIVFGIRIRDGLSHRKSKRVLRRLAAPSCLLLVSLPCMLGCERSPSGRGVIPPHRTYAEYCAGCHGVEGDGRGPAARYLLERPRDFTRAVFKFKSTPGGELPTDGDLLRTIERGLRGTAMPAFGLFDHEEKAALLDAIRGFSPRWEEPERPGESAIPADPFGAPLVEDAVRRGEAIYHARAQCASCHPVYLPPDRREAFERAHGVLLRREKPEASVVKPGEDGREVRPPDFRVDPLKSVRDSRDLYRVIAMGVDGTEMPTWDGVLERDEIWALVHYVESLRREGERVRMARRAPEREGPR